MSEPQSEKVKKELQELFKEFGLNSIIECNKTTVGYLDVILIFLDGIHKLYQKRKIRYSTFTKNPITLQTSSNKIQLQSKQHFLPTTHQTKQFSSMQQQIMKTTQKIKL